MGGRQRSTIDLLPEPVRQKLQDLLNDRQVTQIDAVKRINEILSEMSASGELPENSPSKVSKSAVNRYAITMEEVGAKLRQGREIAEMMIGRVGADPQGQVGLMINEMLRGMAFDLSLKIQNADLDDPEAMSATIDQVKALALAMQRLEQSATINVKREQDIRKQAAVAAANVAEKTLTGQGMSRDGIEAIKKQILEIA